MGSAPSSRATSVERERTVGKEELSALSKSEKAKVAKLFHRLETNDSGVVPLSTVTRLFHFRNNALVKLVAAQYTSKQDTVIGETDKGSDSKEILNLEKFIELFDILSPKKDSSSKVKAIFNALKNKENGFITSQELASFFKLLLPSTLPQANTDAIVTNLMHQTDCSSLSPEHKRLSLEDFTKVVNDAEILARLSVQV